MKRIFTPLYLLLITCSVFAQSVSSSCVAEDSLYHYYQFDATKLAIRNLYNSHSADTSSIVVSDTYIDQIMRALVAVHQADDLPARDEVVDFYNIHALEAPATNRFTLYADTSYAWVRNWINNELSTDSEEINMLVDSFGLFFPRSTEWAFEYDLSVLKVYFQSAKHLNLKPLMDRFLTKDGILRCESTIYQGEEEKDIQYLSNPTENYVDLIYRYGWGGCENGCQNEHFWNFRVYMNDCSVEFLSDSGSPLLVNNLNSISQVLVYPNPPTEDQMVNVKIVGPANSDFIYYLHDAYGQLIESRDFGFHNGLINLQIDLNPLPVGVYFITLSNDNQIITERVMRN